jgi:hypothetical protein
MKTRRGTGYYKVPSLKGVWYRSMFGHSGWCATLEDWFDPRRLRDDYVPTGFRGAGVKTRAVRGHEFGLKLSAEDKAAADCVSEDAVTGCAWRGLSGPAACVRGGGARKGDSPLPFIRSCGWM